MAYSLYHVRTQAPPLPAHARTRARRRADAAPNRAGANGQRLEGARAEGGPPLGAGGGGERDARQGTWPASARCTRTRARAPPPRQTRLTARQPHIPQERKALAEADGDGETTATMKTGHTAALRGRVHTLEAELKIERERREKMEQMVDELKRAAAQA